MSYDADSVPLPPRPAEPQPAGRPRFQLLIESLPSDVPTVNRLRRLLKAMLRGYSMRCIECKEVKAEDAAGDPPPTR